MRYTTTIPGTPSDGGSRAPAHAVVDQAGTRYGVAARDIFSEPRWTQVEPVRARDWHDVAGGTTAALCSETTFD